MKKNVICLLMVGAVFVSSCQKEDLTLYTPSNPDIGINMVMAYQQYNNLNFSSSSISAVRYSNNGNRYRNPPHIKLTASLNSIKPSNTFYPL